MAARAKFDSNTAMASPWRRRRMCVLVSDAPAPAALRSVSGAGAFLETNARPELGSRVALRHPEAGEIGAVVQGIRRDGIELGFERGEKSVAFALAAITADMSNPAL
ncbi:MAG TPA: hypothetical protein VF582_02615 [Allosphingosinicella sp.]|jgi:hypothetical protein